MRMNKISGSPGPASPRPIRVLHSVGHLLRGGIETWLYQTIKKLTQFEHHILVRTDKEEPFTAAFREIGARVVPCANYTNPVRYAINFNRVVQENGPYDILHVHGSNPNGLLAMLLAKQLGIPATIVHSHNDVRPLLATRSAAYGSYVALTMQCLRQFADRGFAVSVRAAESMFGSGWQHDHRWSLLYCGVDFQPFAEPPDPNLRKLVGIPEGAFVVGHVGRFHEQKNHQFLVKIAQEAVKASPDVHFLFIGDGDLRMEIVSQVRSLGLESRVTFVPDTLCVPQFMLSVMDCFVFPSRYEGLGLVAVEAQAAGLPCILSDRIPTEVVVDSELVTTLSLQDSPQRWVAALLHARAGRIHPSASHFQQFYASQFNLDRCAQSLADAYELLVTNRQDVLHTAACADRTSTG
jgi:glycosyltransferase involved in cell wall biosynthesis